MSSLGTTPAAGVAQTALNAQQTARRIDRSRNQSEAQARRMKELLETHMQALDEGDEFESPAQLHIDSQVPDHGNPRDTPKNPHQKAKPERSAFEKAPGPEASAQPGDSPLYRHLDVEA
ncbi:MAG: hypothetical protein GC164_12065 [Phycisphaera sp.]|nr:hypothetical protein [Phycisphaera sp.]